jgi:hypothetical protein
MTERVSQHAGSKTGIINDAATRLCVAQTHNEKVTKIEVDPKMNETTINLVNTKKTVGIPNFFNLSFELWGRKRCLDNGFESM